MNTIKRRTSLLIMVVCFPKGLKWNHSGEPNDFIHEVCIKLQAIKGQYVKS